MLDTNGRYVVASVTEDLGSKAAEARAAGASALELRIDLYAGDALQDLGDLDSDLPVIVTCRPNGYDEGERSTLLSRAVEHAEAVDLDLETVDGVRESVYAAADLHGATKIASYHDHGSTPSEDKMHSILDRALDTADVAKLAVTPSGHPDVHRLLGVTLDRRNDSVATMAMGNIGSYSRVLAPVYGSLLTYGSVGEPTAPGQLPVGRLATLVQEFGGGSL